jgi:nitrogen-specific signal transduction histidine kinase
VNDTDQPLLLEDALRGYLSRRCKRAYAHEMRNGLQGIYGGVDALVRAARSTKPTQVPLERLTQFVQQAISNHERGLDHVLESVAAEEDAPAPIDINAFMSDLLRFLTHDAARHSVRSSVQIDPALVILASPAKLRLIFLGLLTDAIDSMPDGGNIRISGKNTGRVEIDLLDSRRAAAPASFVSESIGYLVAQLSGRISRQLTPDAGYLVRVELPALSAQPE